MSIISKFRELFSRTPSATEVAPQPPEQPEGPISTRQIELVQSTWASVEPIAEQASTLFYDRLFELDPETKPLFAQSDMEKQKDILMQTLNVAVNGLNQLDVVVPIVQELGRKHVGYGVKPDHYASVGEALLWTLEQGLGQAFTPEVQEAWGTTYTVLADTMKAAAAEVPVS